MFTPGAKKMRPGGVRKVYLSAGLGVAVFGAGATALTAGFPGNFLRSGLMPGFRADGFILGALDGLAFGRNVSTLPSALRRLRRSAFALRLFCW